MMEGTYSARASKALLEIEPNSEFQPLITETGALSLGDVVPLRGSRRAILQALGGGWVYDVISILLGLKISGTFPQKRPGERG